MKKTTKKANPNGRHYTAFCDDGYNYFEFDFNSQYKAKSKANKNEALATYRQKYGYSRKFEILYTALNKDY